MAASTDHQNRAHQQPANFPPPASAAAARISAEYAIGQPAQTSPPAFQSSFARALSHQQQTDESPDDGWPDQQPSVESDEDPPPLPLSPLPDRGPQRRSAAEAEAAADDGDVSSLSSPPASPTNDSGPQTHGAGQQQAAAGKPKSTAAVRLYLPSASTPKRRYNTLHGIGTRVQDQHQHHNQQQQHFSGGLSANNSNSNKANGVNAEIEVLRLRKECQSLIEDNRRLIGATGAQPSANHHHHRPQLPAEPHTSAAFQHQVQAQQHAHTIETAVLQTQIDTLQWQLKQAESSRQMYHAVMEEVVRFLERCHCAFAEQAAQQKHSAALHTGRQRSANAAATAMSRSKSVNQMFVPNDTSSLLNEPLTRHQPSDAAKHGKSLLGSLDSSDIALTGRASEPLGSLKNLMCRHSPRLHGSGFLPIAEHRQSDPGILAEDAFRLLRTAQNLLTLKQPVLAEPATHSHHHEHREHFDDQRRSGGHDDSAHSSVSSSASSTVSSSRHETDEESSTMAAFQRPSALRKATITGVLQTSASTCSSSSSQGSRSASRSQRHIADGRDSADKLPQRSDDESGFSSMSSFQDVGLPLIARPSVCPAPQLPPRNRLSTASVCRLPIDDDEFNRNAKQRLHMAAGGQSPVCHRRWSSTPAPPIPPKRGLSAFLADGEQLKVLWV